MGIFSSNQTSTVETVPWAPQASQLTRAFAEAGQLMDRGTYQGDYYAGMNPFTAQGYNDLVGWGDVGGQGQNILQTLMSQGNNMAGGGSEAMGIARNVAANPFQGTQNSGFDMNNLRNYMNNDVINGQIDAASRDVTRNLYENQLTGNASAAAGTGNLGSSRRGVMDAIAMRGAGDRIADISSGIRSNAYSNALGIEANRASQNANLAQQTGLAGDQTRMGAAGMLNQIGQQGAGMLMDANNLGTSFANNQVIAGNAFQRDENNNIAANMRRWQAPQDLLNSYYGIIGSGNWGGTSTTTSPNPLIGQVLGAAIQSGGKLAGAGMMG